MTDEIWIWARGHLGRYSVSNFGNVRSHFYRAPRLLKQSVDRYGYRYVNIAQKHRKVHRLVCEAFSGPCPEGRECGHLDGDKINNAADNLAWITRSENMKHTVQHGTHGGGASGSRHHSAKLNEEIVRAARLRHAAGESGRKLAKEFGVTSAVMSSALRGASWAKPCAQGDPA